MSVIWITKNELGCDSYVIKCPGTYKLEEDSSFYPKNRENDVAILIDSSNVILDLNGKVLKQSSHKKHKRTDVTGIVVLKHHKNITIVNGFVKDFGQRGIYVQGGNSYVTLQDLTVIKCGYGTLISLFSSSQNKGISQCGIQLGDTKFYELLGLETFKGLLHQIKVKNVSVNENSFGLALGEGSEYLFEDCDFSRNTDYRLIWETVANLNGLFFPKSVLCYGLVYLSNPSVTPPPNFGIKNINFFKCRFNSNVPDASIKNAQGAYCIGCILEVNFSGLKFKNCQFNNNYTLTSETSEYSETCGLLIGAGDGIVIEDCEMSQNFSGNYVAGFNLTGVVPGDNSLPVTKIFQSKGVVLRNCESSNNYITPTVRSLPTPPPYSIKALTSVGFLTRYPMGLTLDKCTAENNYIQLPSNLPDIEGPEVSALCDGVLIYSDRNFPCNFANNLNITYCKFSKNRVIFDCAQQYYNRLSVTSAGIRVYDDLCENIIIKDCVISENLPGINENPYPLSDCANYITAGIDLFNTGEIKTGPSYVTIVNNQIQTNGTFGIYTNLDFTKIEHNNIAYHDNSGVELDNSYFSNVLSNTFLYNDFASVNDTFSALCQPSPNFVGDNKTVKLSDRDAYQVYYCFDEGCIPACPATSNKGTFSAFPTTSDISFSNTEVQKDNNTIPTYTTLCSTPSNSYNFYKISNMDNKEKKDLVKSKNKTLFYRKFRERLFK